MKIPTVGSFLCCMTIETGETNGFNVNNFFTGVVISWLQGIGSAFVFAVAIYQFVLFSQLEELCTILKDLDAMDRSTSHVCYYGKWIILIALYFIALSIVTFVISVWCMRGTYLRIHADIKPMMQLMEIVTGLSIVEIFFIPIYMVIIRFICCAYQFIVMYSLYTKYKGEHENSYYEQRDTMNENTAQSEYQRISETK